MRTWICVIAVIFSFASPAADGEEIYWSQNLAGHGVDPECLKNENGEDICCPADPADAVEFQSFQEHGECTANPNLDNVFINAICRKKFQFTFPDGSPIESGRYHYRVEFWLPSVPPADTSEKEIGEFVHLMVLLWGGSSDLTQRPWHTQEATVLISLNPWADPGDVKVYERDLQLRSTGITINLDPDDENPQPWRVVDIYVDFPADKFMIALGGDLRGPFDLAYVEHLDWNGDEVALVITTESQNANPGDGCLNAFRWTTWFRDVHFTYAGADFPIIFADGFESGNTSRWSSSQPLGFLGPRRSTIAP